VDLSLDFSLSHSVDISVFPHTLSRLRRRRRRRRMAEASRRGKLSLSLSLSPPPSPPHTLSISLSVKTEHSLRALKSALALETDSAVFLSAREREEDAKEFSATDMLLLRAQVERNLSAQHRDPLASLRPLGTPKSAMSVIEANDSSIGDGRRRGTKERKKTKGKEKCNGHIFFDRFPLRPQDRLSFHTHTHTLSLSCVS
jgi:hypothetical protein